METLTTNGEAEANLRVKVFDFFSGCGGASRGFQEAGMDVVFALDQDKDAKRTFKRNFPSAIFEAGDIRKVKEDYVLDLVDRERPTPNSLLYGTGSVIFPRLQQVRPIPKCRTTGPLGCPSSI